ncbi:ERF family protein [Ligilactobacillus acidipiscis]|uniref:Essential recombination function protein n=1 Tax=Ligilactobacillus acidipiscis TaxID=89059 RepID=A0A1K1KNV1_9LACO|nr:ERF family protein [Ligilactobacillus acidipiscis]SFV40538.1 Essential recombination function protein [Ligilactobacillus acidipiscis]
MSKALLNIQSKLVAPKGQWNKFGGYAYRSAEDILNAVKPLLTENEATLVLTDEPVLIGDWHYIKAVATFKAKDEEPQVITAYARESESKKGMDASQITGTASSYARKYALNGLFLIDDNKDPDTNSYHDQTNNRKANKPQDKRQQPKARQQTSDQDKTTIANMNKLTKGKVEKMANKLGVKQSAIQEAVKKAATESLEGKAATPKAKAAAYLQAAEAYEKKYINTNNGQQLEEVEK